MDVRVPENEAMEDLESVKQFGLFSQHYLKKGYNYVIDYLSENNKTEGKILDLGTGTANLIAAFYTKIRDSKAQLTGIDLSETMLQAASANLVKQCKKAEKQWELKISNVSQILFPDNHFDAVISFASMHHWSCSLEEVIKEVYRVLKSDGIFIIADLKRNEESLKLKKYILSKPFAELYSNSVKASYRLNELKEILSSYNPNLNFDENSFLLSVSGRKTV
jgi:ubiquinone/menaquinone biosynthesis C-methylase UbiE